MRRLIAGAFAGALLILAPARASAEPFAVTSGFLAFDFEGDFFVLSGDGFALESQQPFFFFARTQDPSCGPCLPGQVLNPSFQTIGEVGLGTGRALLGDTLFDDVTWTGSFELTSQPVVFPNTSADFVPVSQPFQFTAFLRGFVGAEEIFAGNLTGSGRGFLIYVPAVSGGYEWEEGVARFFFSADEPAPVPEPSTLLLAGLGAAALLRRRFKSRSLPTT